MKDLTANLLAIQAAIAEATRSCERIVIVTPTDEETAAKLSLMFVALLPSDAKLGGRTALLPNGGRVSIIDGSETPSEGDFHVMFLGFDKLLPADEIAMHAWREAAKGVVRVGDGARVY